MIILEADFHLIFRNWRSHLSLWSFHNPQPCRAPSTTVALPPYLGNPDLHPLLLGAACLASQLCCDLTFSLFQMLILLCLLGSSLGAPQGYYLPSYPAYPTNYPTYNTFLGSGSFSRYYGAAAAIPRTGFSYSFGPGYNFQWRYQCSTTIVLTNIGCFRNAAQSLNFLQPVTFAQVEEKVEDATQEVTQQRWRWFLDCPMWKYVFRSKSAYKFIFQHFHFQVWHPTCSYLPWKAGVGQTGVGEFRHRHQQWDFQSFLLFSSLSLHPANVCQCLQRFANVCLAFRSSWITQGSHGKCPGVAASICSPPLYRKFAAP